MRYKNAEELAERLANSAPPVRKAPPWTGSKYRNIRCSDDSGQKFDSKLEKRVYQRLCLEHGAQNVLRQVSLPITATHRMRPDFMLLEQVNDDGSFVARFIDAKGKPTTDWLLKASVLLEKHGIRVGVVGK